MKHDQRPYRLQYLEEEERRRTRLWTFIWLLTLALAVAFSWWLIHSAPPSP